MTEAGEKWVAVQIRDELSGEGIAVPPSIEMTFLEVRQTQAEFWLRAFCAEVDRRALIICRSEHSRRHLGPTKPPCDTHVGECFDKLKRELLGDQDATNPDR